MVERDELRAQASAMVDLVMPLIRSVLEKQWRAAIEELSEQFAKKAATQELPPACNHQLGFNYRPLFQTHYFCPKCGAKLGSAHG